MRSGSKSRRKTSFVDESDFESAGVLGDGLSVDECYAARLFRRTWPRDLKLCGMGMRDGLCQAMTPRMKTMAKPALAARASMGLRPPVEGSIIMAGQMRGRRQRPRAARKRGRGRAR